MTIGIIKNFTDELRKNITLMKMCPYIDLGLCSDCRGCIEIAPQVFRHNPATGLMEVVVLATYPVDLVEEAMKNCPEDCIFWEKDDE